MCEVMERYKTEVTAKVTAQEKFDIAKRLLSKGLLSYEDIADATKLSLKTVLELAKQQSA